MNLTAKDRQWLQVCAANAEVFRTCSRRAYFAVIVDKDGIQVGTGWNGVPAGMLHCDQGGCPRAAQDYHGPDYSSCKAIHAEANALLHSDLTARRGGTLYVNGTPCWECSKLLAASGLRRVVLQRDESKIDWPKCRELMRAAGLELTLAVA